MQESCKNKVVEKFSVLQPEEITQTFQYVDGSGTFCFNAMVADICKGISKENKISEIEDILYKNEDSVYSQEDTLRMINDIHEKYCNDEISFKTAIDLVLETLQNDGNNIWVSPDDDDEYRDEDWPDPEPRYDRNDLD